MRIERLATLTLLLVALFPIYAQSPAIDVQTKYDLLNKEGVDYFLSSEIGDGEYNWQLLVTRGRGEQQLSVFDSAEKSLLYQFINDDPMDAFVGLTVIEPDNSPPLIASTWLRGAHGEQFILLDPLNQKLLYRATSAWPLTYDACGGGVSITVSTGTDDDGNPISETHYWQGEDQITIRSGETSHCDPSITDNIPPLDEGHQSPSLGRFLKRFDQALVEGDFSTITDLASTDILNSFGGEGGKDEFVSTWSENQKKRFSLLQGLRSGGGELTRHPDGTHHYCIPRMYTHFPESLDPFTHGVIVGEDIPAYAEPNKHPPALTYLSHTIVGIEEWSDKPWQAIGLKQGISAYVAADKVRSPIDYRACFIQTSPENWEMSLLVAGD